MCVHDIQVLWRIDAVALLTYLEGATAADPTRYTTMLSLYCQLACWNTTIPYATRGAAVSTSEAQKTLPSQVTCATTRGAPRGTTRGTTREIKGTHIAGHGSSGPPQVIALFTSCNACSMLHYILQGKLHCWVLRHYNLYLHTQSAPSGTLYPTACTCMLLAYHTTHTDVPGMPPQCKFANFTADAVPLSSNDTQALAKVGPDVLYTALQYTAMLYHTKVGASLANFVATNPYYHHELSPDGDGCGYSPYEVWYTMVAS